MDLCQLSPRQVLACALVGPVKRWKRFWIRQFLINSLCFDYSRWSQHHSRPLMGKEMMAVTGMPCNDALAKSAGVPSYDFTGISNSAQAWLLGMGFCFLFGMSLPQSTVRLFGCDWGKISREWNGCAQRGVHLDGSLAAHFSNSPNFSVPFPSLFLEYILGFVNSGNAMSWVWGLKLFKVKFCILWMLW